jgi:hypothetical protein
MPPLMSRVRGAAPRASAPDHDADTVQLTTQVLEAARVVETDESPTPPPVGWAVVAVAGGLVTAAATWVLWAGVAVIGWLAAEPGTLRSALVTGTNLWLLANGISARFGTIVVTLIPWGATALIAYMIKRWAALTTRHVREGQSAGTPTVSLVLVASYLVPVFAVSIFFGEPWQAPEHWAAVTAVLLGAAAWGSVRAAGRSNPWPGPPWLRALPRAVLATQLVLLSAGAAVVVTALALQRDRVSDLTAALETGILGGTALLLGQLAFAPNLCVWAASYALGAGFGLGTGSVVAPAGSQLGLLPGIPVLGALPAAGPGGAHLLWWLAAGVLAGVAGACLVVLGRPPVRFDESSLVGGLAGLLGGAAFAGLAWAASGDLGTLRLVGLGPRLLPLLIMAATTVGLAGLITGLLLGLVRRRVRVRAAIESESDSIG